MCVCRARACVVYVCTDLVRTNRGGRPRIIDTLPFDEKVCEGSRYTLDDTVRQLFSVQGKHKISMAAMTSMFCAFAVALPSPNIMCTYGQAQRYMDARGMRTMDCIAVCVNDCIMYTNFKHLHRDDAVHRGQHSELTQCFVCDHDRLDLHGRAHKVRPGQNCAELC
jgi:hypothetical protein